MSTYREYELRLQMAKDTMTLANKNRFEQTEAGMLARGYFEMRAWAERLAPLKHTDSDGAYWECQICGESTRLDPFAPGAEFPHGISCALSTVGN